MNKIYIIKTEDFNNDELTSKILSEASEYRKAKIERSKHEKSRLEAVAGTYLLQYAFNELGLKEKSVSYYENKNGKPYIKDMDSFYFNISHSKDYAVLGICEHELGIDIQNVSQNRTDVAKRFFSESEKHYIFNLDDENRTNEFFRIWSIKEAYLKYLGTGLKRALDSFSVDMTDFSYPKIKEDNQILISEFSDYPEYYISVCSKEHRFNTICMLNPLI